MYDYKFRQSEVTFGKPRRPLRRLILRATAVVLVGAAIYAGVQMDFPWQSATPEAGSGSDVIPLSLPPQPSTPPDADPERNDSQRPAELPDERAFTKAMHAFQDSVALASITGHTTERAERGALPEGEQEKDDRGKLDIPATLAREKREHWIEHVVEPGDSLSSIFENIDLSPQLLQSILRSGKQAKRLEAIRPGDKLRIHLDAEQQFSRLQLQLDALRSLEFAATDEGITGSLRRKPTSAKARVAVGTIESSLFSSARKVGLPDPVTMKLAAVFGWDIDFALEIRSGDQFRVVYEELWTDDEMVASGEVLAAEFVNKGRTYRAIRFEDSQGKVDYYAPDGRPLKKTFFRTPVEFSRISSGFSRNRWHPVLKRSRAHKGVDYAAPTGTPVIATGDATVEYAGWKKGYGRVVQLRHGRTYQTVYGHLSRLAKGLDKGDRVSQGQIIGYVGKTGLATGPHLHYEFLVDGDHRNPLTVKAPIADPLPKKERKRFGKIAEPLLAQLEETSSSILVADAR